MSSTNQLKLVTLVGVGALGSHVAYALRNEARLKVIDFDRVEQKNVLSQFHGKGSVGSNKTNSMKQSMAFLFNVKIEGVPHKLAQDNVEQLLSGSDLVIDCLDNAASRRIVQNFCKGGSIPCLHGALAAGGVFGRAVWTEQFVIDSEAGAGAATCEDGEFLPFICLVSSCLATSAQEFLKNGRKIGFQIHPQGMLSI
jgi:predicted ThiF/HesA family dinucleotide-utilizing enzyme